MKNYLCKDCPENNNGWCKKKQMQGLKNVTQCEYRNNDESGKIYVDAKATYSFPNITESIKYPSDELENAKYKQFGKREMFYIIQQQMIGIDIDKKLEDKDKFKILMQVMVGLEKMLLIEEQIHGIALDYELEKDMLVASKAISNSWLNTVGEYKGE